MVASVVRRSRFKQIVGCLLASAVLFATASMQPQTAHSQGVSSLPNEVYFLALQSLYSGEYRDAMEGFRDASRSGWRVDGIRWVDSICYHTMAGECLYRMGRLREALAEYNAALHLHLANPDWMLRVQFPDLITESGSSVRSRITWATSQRPTKLGRYPDTMSILMGRSDNFRVLQRGGVVAPEEFRPFNVVEILRCTALAFRRRGEIMGPTCPLDRYTEAFVAAAARQAVPPNHWSKAWGEAVAGAAYSSAGKVSEAAAALQRSLLVAGQFDHPLTGAALLELGKLAFQQRQFDAAARYFLEATITAAQFSQFDDVEEAFRYGTLTHLVTNQKGLYPPLSDAASWARARRARALEASLYLSASENSTAQGQSGPAAGFLGQAQRVMARSDMLEGAIGGRFQYQTAHVNFQQGNLAGGNAALALAMAQQRNGSPWLLQIAIADKFYVNGDLLPRPSHELFEIVLREPSAQDWIVNPQETLGVLAWPPLQALEHWFELLLATRGQNERALEIADRIRRQRFFATLPMGGRMLALRWMLEAPTEVLNETAAIQRQDVLLKYPEYAKLATQSRTIREKLQSIGISPADEKAAKEQAKLLNELEQLSAKQESFLSDLALRHQPSEFVFPPQRTVKEIQDAMLDGQLVLGFFSASRGLYTFVLTKTAVVFQKLADPEQVSKEIATLLRDMGHFGKNQSVDIVQLETLDWKTPATKILELVAANVPTKTWNELAELVVVPDGIFWYLPFEVLQVPSGESTTELITKIRVRYAPTVSTTVPDRRGTKRHAKTAVVAGKLFPRDNDQIADAAFVEFGAAVPDATRLSGKLPSPSSLFVSLCDRLVVLDDIDESPGHPYDWSPMQMDRGKPGSTLAQWLALPWNGPTQVVLPGYHTVAEDALRNGGTGEEVYLTVCGLMASGARTILLSRWRTAGQTSYDLTREFVRELPHLPASKAWQRSVQLTMAAEIDPELEPRIKSTGFDKGYNADHPFFWSGYLLVDTGNEPKTDETEPAGLAAEVKEAGELP